MIFVWLALAAVTLLIFLLFTTTTWARDEIIDALADVDPGREDMVKTWFQPLMLGMTIIFVALAVGAFVFPPVVEVSVQGSTTHDTVTGDNSSGPIEGETSNIVQGKTEVASESLTSPSAFSQLTEGSVLPTINRGSKLEWPPGPAIEQGSRSSVRDENARGAREGVSGNVEESTPMVLSTPLSPLKSFTLGGHVVAQQSRLPLGNCVVVLGQSIERTGKDGRFNFHLSAQPKEESLFLVTHPDGKPNVMRLDDYLRNGPEIVLDAKWRILVTDFDVGQDQKHWAGIQRAIQLRMSEWFNECSDIGVLAGEKRAQVISELYKFQETRALYDKETLAKVGSFHGATHGVFGSLKPGASGRIEVECSLIDLQSGQKVKSASTQLVSEAHSSEAAIAIVDELLAKISSIKILHPRDSAIVPKDTTFQGHILYQPKSWKLWISVLPHGSDQHFPQLPVTIDAHGTWLAPRVQIGPDGKLPSRQNFEVYAVLVSPTGSKRIDEYHTNLKSPNYKNEGLPLGKWPEGECRLLSSIRLSRDDDLTVMTDAKPASATRGLR